VFKLPATPFLMEADHHIFLYEGMRLFQGDRIYADFFEFTFPGTQTFYWTMFSLFGLRYWILGATIIGLAAASVSVCLSLSKRVIEGPMYIVPALIFIFFGFRWLGVDGSHRMFSPIFVLLALWFVLRDGKKALNLFTAGSLCAFASFFTQPRGFVAVVGLIVFVILDGLKQTQRMAAAISPALLLFGSFSITLALLCSYFVLTAGWTNFFYDTVIYPLNFYSASEHNDLAAFTFDLGNIFHFRTVTNVLAAVPFLFYLFFVPATYVAFWTSFAITGRSDWTERRSITSVAIVGSMLTVAAAASPNSARLFQIAIPGLVVLVWMAGRVVPVNSQKKIALAMGGLLMMLGCIQSYRMQTWEYRSMPTPAGTLSYLPTPVIDERYSFLLKNSQPKDAVFEVYEPFVYFPLQLKNPTPYGQIWPSDYTRPEQVADAIAHLTATRPRYIIWDNLYSKPDEERAPGDHTGPLAKFVAENYHPANSEVDIGEAKIQIWERNY
ncbi:MAG: hypothetical protein JO053_08775, partial [Acidobacteria bacterium]|nr:hypothetical protein [Acidobacteriota bacterium]